MVHVVKGDEGRLCLDKKLCRAVYPEIIIRPASSLRRELDNDVPGMGSLLRLVFYVPAEGFEKGVQEIYPDLRLRIAF